MIQEREPNLSPKIYVGKTISESWRLVRGLKWSVFWPLILTAIIIGLFAGISVPFVMNIPSASNPTATPTFHFSTSDPRCYFAVLTLFLLSAVVWYMISAVIMLGVRQSLGMPVRVKDAFADCMAVKAKLLGLLVILFAINAVYGFVNAFTPSIVHVFTYFIMLYFVIPLYIFSLPLIVLKRCDLIFALQSGFSRMSECWFAVFMCYLLMFFILVMSAIPFGLGLIWTIPMYYALIGVLFKEAYGLQSNGVS